MTFPFRLERVLFSLTSLGAASMMWLSPRLPMIDLPQHAAQVALWRDLLLGQSAWADLVRINLLTPYLLGYGLLLPLSLFFSLSTASKILLTSTLLSFVAASMLLRREFGADKRLDWLFLISFFGFCWKWGFLTFLVASPLALMMIWLALRHARAPSLGRGVVLVLLGAMLLLAHGLMFLAALGFAGLQMLETLIADRFQAFFQRSLPYVALSMIILVFRLLTQQVNGALKMDEIEYGSAIWQRPVTLLVDIADMNDQHGTWMLPLTTIILLLMPLSLRLGWNIHAAFVPLVGLIFILLAMPSWAFETGGLYFRFALFIPVFWALIFKSGADVPSIEPASAKMGGLAIMLCCWTILGIQASRIIAFSQESRSFETVLAAAEPSQRAYIMTPQAASLGAVNSDLYEHFPAWYQADKHGFVDFNFANFAPQVIRFKTDYHPIEDAHPMSDLGQYAWTPQFIAQYRYIFVRGSTKAIEQIKSTSPCPLSLKASDGLWALLERGICPQL